MSTPVASRAEVDRCPGVLRPHQAADGALLRLRVPGGRLRAEVLDIVSAAAGRFADGDVQLTSRANLQLRGVATDHRGAVHPRLVDEIVRAGLLPHPGHERVRNILCSPLTGILGGVADLRPLVRELDDRLCSTAALAALPGPFLFVLDDGRGDLAARSADLGVTAVDERTVRVQLGGLPIGPVVTTAAAAGLLIALAERFLPFTGRSAGAPVWHVRELPQGGLELLGDALSPELGDGRDPALDQPAERPLGPLTQDDGRLLVSVLAPLGLLTPGQCTALVRSAAQGSGELIVTPWRGVIVPDLSPEGAASAQQKLDAVGLGMQAGASWRGLTACTGAPRCASGRGETRSLAALIARTRAGRPAAPVHLVGCERRCGSPAGPHVEVLTSGDSMSVSAGGSVVDCHEQDAVPAAIDIVAGSLPAVADTRGER